MLVDLRSDTVTRPTPAMRHAMANAEVGDDVFGEDPTAARLEERAAAVVGKEAALFVPSGTMSNQIALQLGTRRGDEIYIGEGAHCAYYETGAGAAIAGVQFVEVGRGGLFTAAELGPLVKPLRDWHPRARMVVIENTHNRAGGRVFPPDNVARIARAARALGLAMHLDGARIWNAAVASSLDVRELAAPFDTVSVCFSKGLGAPVGSALLGSREAIAEARRLRKMMGGGMRQVGVLAAGALFALEHHRARLAEDHAQARALARALAERLATARMSQTTARGAGELRVHEPETNIVNIDVGSASAERVAAIAAERGVLTSASGPCRVRAVTHLDVVSADMARAADVLAAAIEIALEAANEAGEATAPEGRA